MPKAVAIQTLFIVVFIGMTIFFTFLVFSNWLGLQVPQLTSLGCASAKISYCGTWQVQNNCQEGKAPTDWNSQNCGTPPSKTDCKDYCTGIGG